jgi:hypothetical protein
MDMMDGRMDEWMDEGWTNGWTKDGRMDEWTKCFASIAQLVDRDFQIDSTHEMQT